MRRPNPFDEQRPFGKAELRVHIDELAREAAGGPRWQNSTVESYLDAMDRWLSGQRTPAPQSLERRMVGHVLFPRDEFESLDQYFDSVRGRVSEPRDRWPEHLECPEPDWRVIGKALSAASVYD